VTHHLSVIVLAGGDARRLGGRKADRHVAPRQRLMDPALELAAELSDDVLLLDRTRSLPAPGTRRVADLPDVPGPLGGLGAGLAAARHDWCLLLPCDLPRPDRRVVDALLADLAGDATSAFDAAVVTDDARRQPFHGLYHRRLLETVTELASGPLETHERRSLTALLERCARRGRLLERPLDTLGAAADGAFLQDVDTPADLATARRLAAAINPRARV